MSKADHDLKFTAQSGKIVKAHVPGESFWVEEISDRPNHVKVRSICMEEGLFLDDIVEIDAHHNVLRVVERTWKCKSLVRYAPTSREACQLVSEALKQSGCATEGYLPGMLAVMHNEDLSIPALKTKDGTEITVSYAKTTLQYGEN
jgi:hypothetical protein